MPIIRLRSGFYRRSMLLVTLIVVLVAGKPLIVRSEDRIPKPDPRFGAVESYYRPDDAVEAGVGWERMIFEWRDLQPNSPNDWNTSHWERWLSDAQHGGRMVVGLIKNAPFWATGTTVLGAVPKGLDLPIDDPNNQWAEFMRKLVTYYSRTWGLHHWIIYNEPDILPKDTQYRFYEFGGEIEDYYKMVKVAYKVAHSLDPQAVIHLAGFALWYDINAPRPLYLEQFVRLAYKDPEGPKNKLFFDVLTVHAYDSADWVWRMTQQLRSIPQAYHFNKPVWIDEMNIRPTTDGDLRLRGKSQKDDPEITPEDQASFIIQATVLAMAAGADRIGIYRLYDNDYDPFYGSNYEAWGLIRNDGSRRPGYYALQTVTHYFTNVASAQRISYRGVILVMLAQPEGISYVLWNTTTQPITVRVQAGLDEINNWLIHPTGEQESLFVRDVTNGASRVYQFDLPPCHDSCAVEGSPRIVYEPGRPRIVWILKDGRLDRIN